MFEMEVRKRIDPEQWSPMMAFCLRRVAMSCGHDKCHVTNILHSGAAASPVRRLVPSKA